MAIEIKYDDTSGTPHAGLNVLRTQGLKAYFDHYESTFAAATVDPINVVQDGQAFSTKIGTGVSGLTTNPIPASLADLQWGGNTSLSTGESSAFIAEVQYALDGSGKKIVDSSLVVGQLAYTLFNNPSHTLSGELNTVYLGDQATLNETDPLSPDYQLHSMNLSVIEITNLASVLNGGIQETAPDEWAFINRLADINTETGLNDNENSIWFDTEYGSNDTHNIIYDLMSRHGMEEGPKETAALQHVLNQFDLDHIGTIYNEVFDGFAGKDTFKVGGGEDTVKGFDFTQDVLQVTTGYGHSTAVDVLAASFDGTFNGEAGAYVFDNFWGISHFTFLVGVSTSDLSVSNFAIG